MNVTKRNRDVEAFNIKKIHSALSRTFAATGVELTDEHFEELYDTLYFDSNEEIPVEEIQDQLEQAMFKAGDFEQLKAFILYRNEHEVLRSSKNQLVKGITEKLMARDIENQNANLDEASFGGRIGEASRVVTKQYALDHLISKKSRRNHENNEIYIHDLDSYAVGMHNCLSIPFDDLLRDGFNTRQCDIRPANSVSTALNLIAVIFQVQSLQQFGGVAATHIDWTLAPYVRKSFYKHYKKGMKYFMPDVQMSTAINDSTSIDSDLYKENIRVYNYALDLTTEELYQAVEGMYHNLNTLQSRSGNQLPFTSINYGTCTETEGRMVTKALLDGSISGVGKFHKTAIFPCGIFQYAKGINDKEGTPNYDLYQLALKSTSKRLYPNYANIDWSGNAGYDKNDPRTYFSTMGCRTANGYDVNGFGQMKDGRGNICPVTIILPTLAMEADRDVEKFMRLLGRKIEEAKDMLIERFDWICSQNPASAKFMWENGTMKGYVPEEGIRSALKHGTLTIGQLGLAEALQLLVGTDQTTEDGMKLAKRIEGLFKKRCAEYKEKYSLNFGVYYTPAENLCYTAMKKFKAKYGIIKNVSDRDYFTNSNHVPVWHDIDPFKKIDIESQLTGYSSAGCITYVELPVTTMHNTEALEEIVNYAMEHDIPYFAVNVPNDTCQDCGFTGEINDTCPMCGSHNIQRLRRVTGYLTGDYKTAFNYGKQMEVADRAKHIKG